MTRSRPASPANVPTASRSTRSTSRPTGTTPASFPGGAPRRSPPWTRTAAMQPRTPPVLGLPADLAAEVVTRVRAKLAAEPIEDLRIDFEDGYGNRSDAEEDEAVDAAAAALRQSIADGSAAPFHGIRFKSFEAPTRARGVRSLARFVEAVAVDGRLPEGFVVTLPKVTSVDQVEAMVLACERLEAGLGLVRRRDRLRDPGRDAAVDPRSRRDGPRRPHGARVGGAVHRTALRHLRLLGLVRHRGAVPVDGAPGRRPRQGRHAGGRRRHRCAALGRVHQRPARR